MGKYEKKIVFIKNMYLYLKTTAQGLMPFKLGVSVGIMRDKWGSPLKPHTQPSHHYRIERFNGSPQMRPYHAERRRFLG